MRPILLIILYKRPDYTRQVLEALAAQPEISQFHCHIQIDGCVKEVIDLAVAFNATSKTIIINGANLGCTANVYTGLANAFNQGEYVVVVEDDCLPSHDFLRYMLWARQFINADCRTVSGYHKYEECPESLYNTVHYMSRWCGWSWATTREHWLEAAKVWDWSELLSWDLMIAHNYFWQRKTVMPYLSRCKNIGALNGTYTVDEAQHTRDVLIHKWADSVGRGLLGEYVFTDVIPEGEQIIWEESKDFLYKDLKQ